MSVISPPVFYYASAGSSILPGGWDHRGHHQQIQCRSELLLLPLFFIGSSHRHFHSLNSCHQNASARMPCEQSLGLQVLCSQSRLSAGDGVSTNERRAHASMLELKIQS